MKRKIVLLLGCLLVFFLTMVFAFGRYIYNYVDTYILESKGFYFNSLTMSSNGTSHRMNNWDGVNVYNITIDLNNRKNEYIHTETDIEYNINLECSENVVCSISKESSVIQSDVGTDSYIISFVPRGGYTFTAKDTAVIKTSATSTFPYSKTLETEYIIGIETMGFSYNVIDSAGNKYLELELNNGLTFYQIIEAFDSYHVNDHLSIADYQSLSEEKKAKCKSANISINIDTSRLRVDMTDTIFINKGYNKTTNNINGNDYINAFSFNMNANSTNKLKFYKLDANSNYSNDEWIIRVNVDLAE